MKQLNEIIKESVEKFTDEWQRYLCPAPASKELGWLERAEIGRERTENFLISSQIALLEAELLRKKGMMKDYIWDNGDCSICGFMSIVHDEDHGCAYYNQAIQEDIKYLEEQLDLIKKMV